MFDSNLRISTIPQVIFGVSTLVTFNRISKDIVYKVIREIPKNLYIVGDEKEDREEAMNS
jgi:hypothetical protein